MAKRSRVVTINRAPVLTLWAAVVSERLGFDRGEALTFGKAVAGLNAQSKGRRLGIFKPGKDKGKKAREGSVARSSGSRCAGGRSPPSTPATGFAPS